MNEVVGKGLILTQCLLKYDPESEANLEILSKFISLKTDLVSQMDKELDYICKDNTNIKLKLKTCSSSLLSLLVPLYLAF